MLGSCMTSRSIKQRSSATAPAKTAAAPPFPALLDAIDELNKSCRAEGLAVDGWSVDFQKKCVRKFGWNVRLAPVELMIFARLLAAPDEIIRSGEFHSLLARWSGDAQPDDLNLRLRVCVAKLRAKFARRGLEAPIVAVRGVGYRFVRDGAATITTKPN